MPSNKGASRTTKPRKADATKPAGPTALGWSPVYRVVKRIPKGRVSTYGEIAARAGMPRAARQVGWALNALEGDEEVPWHRVINAQGRISGRAEREIEDLQRALLESEGVVFDRLGRVDLSRYGWSAAGKKQTTAESLGRSRPLKKTSTRRPSRRKAARKETKQ